MLNLYQARGELRGMSVKEFIDEIEKQCEVLSNTPGEWSVGKLKSDVDPVKWFSQCLSMSPDGKDLWMCFRGDVTPDGEFTHDKPMMSVTGNGETSESRAMFLAFCRNAMPSILWLLHELVDEAPSDPPKKHVVRNVRWIKDAWGDYWVGELFEGDKRVGITGSYYSLDETGNQRLSKEEQEAELLERFAE